MAITADDVMRLRELSGAGVMDCKRALEEASGNIEKAAQLLREHGVALAEKKASRSASQGIVESYIHAGGRIGVIVEVNCETDFVARTDTFRELAHDLAMQIAATNPAVVAEDDLPAGTDRDPADAVLLLQPFIKDPGRSIANVVRDAIARTGENIVVRRFARFELGGGNE